MNARICLMGVAMLALICLAGSAQATTLVSDNFEGYTDVATTWNDGADHDPAGRWTIGEDVASNIQVMANPATGAFTTPYGNQYMHMTRVQQSNADSHAYVNLSAGEQAMINNKDLHWEAKFYSGNVEGGGNLAVSAWNTAGPPSGEVSYANSAWMVEYLQSGIKYYNGVDEIDLPTLSAAFQKNAWNSVAIDTNFATGKWSATVNGVTVDNLALSNALSSVQSLWIESWGFNQGTYRTPPEIGIDNVLISTTATPEPSCIAMCVTGILGLLAYAWRKRK
jgi:hypothetical protein